MKESILTKVDTIIMALIWHGLTKDCHHPPMLDRGFNTEVINLIEQEILELKSKGIS